MSIHDISGTLENDLRSLSELVKYVPLHPIVNFNNEKMRPHKELLVMRGSKACLVSFLWVEPENVLNIFSKCIVCCHVVSSRLSPSCAACFDAVNKMSHKPTIWNSCWIWLSKKQNERIKDFLYWFSACICSEHFLKIVANLSLIMIVLIKKLKKKDSYG